MSEDIYRKEDIILTTHAKERMIQRNISLDEILDTLQIPDYTIKKDEKIEAYKKIKEKNLRIIYSKEGKFIKIITVIDKS
jgi:esterase/lipase superfamily enzyme